MILSTGVYVLILSAINLTAARKNVLFLIADDYRPNLDVYTGLNLGPSHTPNLDDLASKSLLVKRGYVQYALCNPSRSSFMTGRRPDTTHVYDLNHYFRTVGGNFTTMPQYFKQQGYRSIGMGKIYHPGKAASNDNDPPSWTEYYQSFISHPFIDPRTVSSWRAVSDSERKQHPLVDEETAEQAKQSLRNLSLTGEPFFLAVGFRKPHLPFEFPQSFLNQFSLDSIHVPTNQYAPSDMPEVAWHRYPELRSYRDIAALNATGDINTTLPEAVVKDLRRAYFSAVSYMDSLVGDVLAELKRLNLTDNTIISFIGDHGFSLGEHGLWTKPTNFEDTVHAPMMIRVPGLTDGGLVTDRLVEFVDLFPTIVEAAGIPEVPLCPKNSENVALCHEGRSMMPLLRNPGDSQWKKYAFSQCSKLYRKIMGYTVRSDRYRYTEWVRFKAEPKYVPDFNEISGVELYDHSTDPQENTNLAPRPDQSAIVAEMRKILRAGWRDAQPSIIGK